MTANILVVDDLEPNIKVLEAKLLKEYYVVYTANSGFAALEVLKNHKIDVILLDCMMPELDGFETCRKIKANPDTNHIPVVIVTALYDVEYRIKGLEAGADEFLTKPVNDTALFARLKSLSRIKSIIDELKLRNVTNIELGIKTKKISQDFSNSKILIINDDTVQSKHMMTMLSRLTSNIKIISDETMIDSLKEEQFVPDATIISCQIEKTDPLRLLASFKTNPYIKNSSIMMLAEEENMPMVIKALDLGASDYFIVPIDTNELIARIKTQLRRKYYQESLRTDLETGMNLAIKDGLSNLFNRRYFDTHLPHLIEKSQESDKSLYALMLDIDNFKAINDVHGHQIGDNVIKLVSGVLLSHFRITDLVARYGGEEFIVILYDVDDKDILDIAERARDSISKCVLTDGLQVTASIGITKYLKTDSPYSFIGRTDKALYEAKNSGRNNVKLR
jgi:two-component system cell cycle response regulator